MNVTFEKKDELNGTISVGISTEDYLPSYDKKLKDYSKKANIPGFRAGHAPKSMVEKMVGNNMLLEEINALASKGLFDYIEENKLNILGQPILTEDTKIDELSKEANYTFKFDLGLTPEISLNISNADVFTKYSPIVTDAMIEDELARMKKQFGTLTDVETVGENDMIYVALTELNDANEAFEGGVDAASVPVAVNTIKDTDLSDEIIGKAKGTELNVNIFALFNNDESEMGHALGIQKQTVADLNPTFKMVINEVKRTEASEMNQEFFDKLYGKDVVTSEEQLKEKVKEELNGYFNQQAQHLLEHELFDTLVAKHNIQLPDAFLKRWLMDRHTDKFTNENIDEAYIPEANYLRNHILEEKILVENKIVVSEEEIKDAAMAYTKQMFGAYGNQGLSDDLLMSIVEPQLKKDDFRSKMINMAVRQRVNEYILNTITIEPKEISAEEFFKVMETHNHSHHQHAE
ncbi:MAG: trigger factor [Bacteroidia bacterium]|nr:trigger factor [Bacteroidia bacterium]MCF8425945.1 trigger factor [Bacteroidia bacterium]MCF8446292.1 trigger factor [Bacteroidia bacterium]